MLRFLVLTLLLLTSCGGELNTTNPFSGGNAGNDQGSDMGPNGGCEASTAGCQEVVVCGDSVVGGSGNCDGTDLQEQGCTSLGFTAGVLACDTTTCRFDTSMCEGDATCGDDFAVAGRSV